MRAVQYFLRSRRAGSATAALATLAALGWFVVDGPLGNPQNVETRLVWASLFLPLLAAMIISAGTHAPFGEIEHTASTSLAALRLVHVALLFLLSLATLEFLTLGRTLPDAWLLPARNLAGFTGIALLTARRRCPPLVDRAADLYRSRDAHWRSGERGLRLLGLARATAHRRLCPRKRRHTPGRRPHNRRTGWPAPGAQ